MLTIHYFASLREKLNRSQQQVERPSHVTTVDGLIEILLAEEPDCMEILKDKSQVLVAVNQTVTDRNSIIGDNDEIAFFPPMTGG